MLKSAAIKRANKLAKESDYEKAYFVCRDEYEPQRYYVIEESNYWNSTILESDCVYSTVEGHY